MTVWERSSIEEREEYIKFLQLYGALSNLFRQKHGDPIPYLDSKFQETIFAKVFKSQNVDISNTPHDILSIFGNERIGIGLKTWMNSAPSYQKVMQLKSFQDEINEFKNDSSSLAIKISELKNERLRSDYARLGLSIDNNIYHFITRDRGACTINECSYPLVDISKISIKNLTETSFSWTDGIKEYRYTFGDSQIWQKFDQNAKDTKVIKTFEVRILEDPFKFLFDAYYNAQHRLYAQKEEIDEVYLPLYSFKNKEVGLKSGLNSWNAAPKSKGSSTLRPLNEIYIPIPREFHSKYPNFFVPNIFEFEDRQKRAKQNEGIVPEIEFHLYLPSGKRIPARVTQDNFKGLQSGSQTEKDENGKRFGQAALGQWLLIDVLGLKERKLVTRKWLIQRGVDSVRLWHKKNDYQNIYIDFAPTDSFEKFMHDESIAEN